MPLPLSPAPDPSFGNFLPGANAAALAHLRTLAMPGPPVYLWGPAGSGKTHLLQALRRQALADGKRAEMLGVDDGLPPEAAADLPAEAATGAAADPASEAPALWLIDDCDRLDGAAQARAFGFFVAGVGSSQVVAAGRVPPVDLPLREDLRTRLGWGLVFALQPLADGERHAALRQEAARRGIALPDELAQHLLTRFARDLKHLMGLLERLDRYALARSRPLTVPLLRQMLQEDGRW